MNTTTIILLVAAVLVVWVIALYNRFVSLRNRKNEALSDIDVQSKRRFDLIPNLIEAVKGFMKQESSVLENVTKARTAAMNATGSQIDKAGAENMFSSAIKSMFAVAEAYPDLKSNTNFLQLQNELSDTENKMMASRRFYNSTVQDLNTSVQSFPGNLIAGMFGFTVDKFFEVTNAAEKEPVKVQF